MATFKDAAIVLRRLDYSETSQVLALFCRETGQQRLIAKGIKRGTKTRVAVGVDLLEYGRVVYTRRPESDAQLGTMTEWRQEQRFAGLRAGLAAWYTAQYAADRTMQMTQENDPHPALFDALLELLRSLEARDAAACLVRYLWALLRETGLMPELRRCVGCATPITPQQAAFFSARQGGLLCRDCEPAYVEKRRVRPAVVARFAVPAPDTPPAPSPTDAAAIELLDYHLTETLGRASRVSAALIGALGPSASKA